MPWKMAAFNPQPQPGPNKHIQTGQADRDPLSFLNNIKKVTVLGIIKILVISLISLVAKKEFVQLPRIGYIKIFSVQPGQMVQKLFKVLITSLPYRLGLFIALDV